MNVALLSSIQLVAKPLSWLTHELKDKKPHCGPLGPQVVAYKMTERWKAPDRLSPLGTCGGGGGVGWGEVGAFWGGAFQISVWKSPDLRGRPVRVRRGDDAERQDFLSWVCWLCLPWGRCQACEDPELALTCPQRSL